MVTNDEDCCYSHLDMCCMSMLTGCNDPVMCRVRRPSPEFSCVVSRGA